MTVYVDRLREYSPEWYSNSQAARVGARNGHRWCHMWADTAEELHVFARRIGLQKSWAHLGSGGFLHYDLTPGKRTKAIAIGASEREIRRHEKLNTASNNGCRTEMEIIKCQKT
jgi:hypothetical protein